jgi:hypothetical protein
LLLLHLALFFTLLGLALAEVFEIQQVRWTGGLRLYGVYRLDVLHLGLGSGRARQLPKAHTPLWVSALVDLNRLPTQG